MTPPRRPAPRATCAAIVGLLLATLLGTTPARADAGSTPPDGRTAATAAASCWEAKQTDPGASDGVYWLVTPQLQAPQRFWCDMTTDGGGWVLVGRGREGWANTYAGHGMPDDVHAAVTGPAAFAVRQLPSRTIDGLLAGTRVDALADGVRLRRATDTTGTTWQEARFRFAKRDRWVWTWGAEHPVGAYSFGAATGSGGLTSTFGKDNAFSRLDTREKANQGWNTGMAFGSTVPGTAAAGSYLWSVVDGRGGAMPFTQVFVRPKLALADLTFPAVPAGGAPAQAQRPLAESGTEATVWGVTGLANGVNTELTTEVAAFTQVGNRVYVGGNFQYVQRDSAGTARVEQPYLAAFDVTTRQWDSGFRPTLDGQVKALAALPDGTLAVGGDFNDVNGKASPALVGLDAATGATARGWGVDVENRLTLQSPSVRGLDVQDGWLYVAGAFTHLSGGTRTAPVYARAGARVSAADGTPDATWNPAFNGTAVAVDAAADGTRAYFSGYFTQSNGAEAMKGAAVETTAGAAVLPWQPQFSSTKNYQQTVREAGGRVWLGGSEHSLFSYDRSNFAIQSGNIEKNGGDFQASWDDAGTLYAGCHCNEWNYSNAFTWRDVGTSWTQADRIGHLGAWDAASGDVVPDFVPELKGRRGAGPWAIFTDSTGRLWAGGDFRTARRENGRSQWVGGFVTFGQRDSSAPTPPSDLTATRADDTTARLTWRAGTDDRGVSGYEVLRDDRVIGTFGSPVADVAMPTQETRFAVRAVDAAGNRSASTPVLVVQAGMPEPPDTTAPSAPTSLAVTGVGTDEAAMTWDPATDDTGVVGYRVSRDGTQVSDLVEATTWTDTGLQPGTTYRWTVVAVDAAGNVSTASDPASATTPASSPSALHTQQWSTVDGAGWGPAWTTDSGSGVVDTSGGSGHLGIDAGGWARGQLSGVDVPADSELLMSYRWQQSTPVAYLNVFLRGSGGWRNAWRPRNGYGVQLRSDVPRMTLQRVVDGSATVLQTVGAAQQTSDAKQWLRLRVVGDQVQVRTWLDGSLEPTTWSATATDGAVTSGGALHLSLTAGGSNAGAKDVLVDDLSVRAATP